MLSLLSGRARSWLPETLYNGIERSSCAAIRWYSAICAASPCLCVRSPQITTNAGRRRFAAAIARSKLSVSCVKSLFAVKNPNCGSDIWMKKNGCRSAARGADRQAMRAAAARNASTARRVHRLPVTYRLAATALRSARARVATLPSSEDDHGCTGTVAI